MRPAPGILPFYDTVYTLAAKHDLDVEINDERRPGYGADVLVKRRSAEVSVSLALLTQPDPVQEFVAAHEIAHVDLQHMFWRRILPAAAWAITLAVLVFVGLWLAVRHLAAPVAPLVLVLGALGLLGAGIGAWALLARTSRRYENDADQLARAWGYTLAVSPNAHTHGEGWLTTSRLPAVPDASATPRTRPCLRHPGTIRCRGQRPRRTRADLIIRMNRASIAEGSCVSRPHQVGSRMRLEWPRWVWRYRIGQTRIRVYPTGLAALCLVQYVIGLVLLWMLPMWVAILTPEPITRVTLGAMRLDWFRAVVYMPLAVVGTVVHELGHVVGARLAGTPAKSFVLGSHGRIYSETPATPGGQLLLKGSGPLAALAYGSLLLITATAVTTPVGAAGVWAVGNAVANLLPLPPANSDGMSSWRAVRALLATGSSHR